MTSFGPTSSAIQKFVELFWDFSANFTPSNPALRPLPLKS